MTELDEILADLVERVNGATSAAIGGMDGLLIEQVTPGRDLAPLLAEVTNLLSSGARVLQDHVDGGPLTEVILGGDPLVLHVTRLSDELFCVIVLKAGGNLGKARLYARQAAPLILAALE